MFVVVDHDDVSVPESLPFNRRRGLRVPQSRPVKVYEPAASRFFGGRTRNVSTTGLQLEFPSFVQLRPGRLVNVHIGLDDAGQALANRRHMVPARVVWMRTETVMHTDLLLVGVEFLTNTTASAGAA
ncbi:MAG: PilZ domain-containing protein [Burkholderiales bacterium]|nr:PilZ domain-containing protein [Phycisphaerae bacterium]